MPSIFRRARLVRTQTGYGLLAVLSLCTLAADLCGCGGSTPPPGAQPGPIVPPAPPTESNPFTVVAVLGDSVSAGFQNGSLLDTQQTQGWAWLMAQQAGFKLTLPLIGAPGLPAVTELVQASIPPVLQVASGTSAGRDNPLEQATDLAVPGYGVSDLLHAKPTAQPANVSDVTTNMVLGYPAGASGTQLQEGIALHPTTVFLWIGSVDALAADGVGDPSAMIPLASFTADYTQVLSTLKANTSAHLIVANVPDVTKVPYMTPAASLLAYLAQQSSRPSAQIGAELGIVPGDLVTPGGVGQALDDFETQPGSGQVIAPLPPNQVLTASEVAQVQATVDSYNQVIAQQVAAAGGTLVDMHAFINNLAANGASINGYAATTQYLGGLFSVDGIHPSNTGYALMANQFIATTNAALGTSIPLVDVAAVAAKDPLFGPNRAGSTLSYGRRAMPQTLSKTSAAAIFGVNRVPLDASR